MVDDAMAKIIGPAESPSAEVQCLMAAGEVMSKVQGHMAPILQALIASGQPIRKNDLNLQITKFLLDEFRGWSKDELAFLNATVHAGIMLEKLNINN